MFTFTHVKEGVWKIRHENGIDCGDLLMKEDGYYDWWPPNPSHGGYWPEYFLRAVADKLQELNAAWDKEICESFN